MATPGKYADRNKFTPLLLVVVLTMNSLIEVTNARSHNFDYTINGNSYASPAFFYEVLTSPKMSAYRRPSPDTYNSLRDIFFDYEESKFFGADIVLSARELKANTIIMDAKNKEFEEGLISPRLFKPSKHFFSVLEAIRSTELFYIIKEMPKGGVLHAHDTALCSTDFLIELTYRSNLWACQQPGELNLVSLTHSKTKPADDHDLGCSWSLLSTIRQGHGNEDVDEYLKNRFTLYPIEKFDDNDDAWANFMQIFSLVDGLVMYAPNWADYYFQALQEFYNDGVQYLEFRTTLPTLYDMEGTEYKPIDTVRIYKETLDKFKAQNPDFIGSKMIYAPVRNTNADGLDEYIKICIEIKEKYPDFVAGFDLVGQEEHGRPLRDFIPQLLSMPENIDFFFHAGETNWFGASVDENVIDAVLLGTKRIGHGFALVKHPLVLKYLKERDIAIEVNPISNQILQLVTDYRNHPCSHFFANNYPVVISSDDPSFWKAAPLSHDFYIAFLGIASAHSDLRLLKKLAINSIKYSAMDDNQKLLALSKWEKQWNEFIEFVITGMKSSAHSNKLHLIA